MMTSHYPVYIIGHIIKQSGKKKKNITEWVTTYTRSYYEFYIKSQNMMHKLKIQTADSTDRNISPYRFSADWVQLWMCI